MLERDPGALCGRLEPDLDLGGHVGWKVGAAILEEQSRSRFPGQDPSHLEPFPRRLVVDLDQAAAQARVESDAHGPGGIVPAVGPRPVPGSDLLGEDLEGRGGIHRHLHGPDDRSGGIHDRFGPRPRSAWALNDPSCSAQKAPTWSSQAWRATNGSGRSRYIRMRASVSTPSASTNPVARSTRRCLLIAGGLT